MTAPNKRRKKSDRFLVTIGTFDGVHRGHQKLLRGVLRLAKRLKLRSRVVFFVSPPRFHFKPSLQVPLLTTSRERVAMLRALGFERVEVLRFGPRWAAMPHTDFFERYIVRRWKAAGLMVGRDFAFGKGRKGDLAYLEAECARRGMRLGILPLVRVRGRKISSSDIRKLLLEGKVAMAAKVLGHRYALSGRVIHGRGVGSKLGVPTANLHLSPGLLAPPGVFHVRVDGAGFSARNAVCNVGVRPTFRSKRPKTVVEIHIPDWSGQLYGKRLRVEFIKRLRKEKRFKSFNALQRAIFRDIDTVRRLK